ncbi:MAG: hypothetical protein P4L87_03525 [Formivibrio sp.]|nr:hypothetical protein [Formivibrio sp.]
MLLDAFRSGVSLSQAGRFLSTAAIFEDLDVSLESSAGVILRICLVIFVVIIGLFVRHDGIVGPAYLIMIGPLCQTECELKVQFEYIARKFAHLVLLCGHLPVAHKIGTVVPGSARDADARMTVVKEGTPISAPVMDGFPLKERRPRKMT